jgi:hypothetical protein
MISREDIDTLQGLVIDEINRITPRASSYTYSPASQREMSIEIDRLDALLVRLGKILPEPSLTLPSPPRTVAKPTR